MSPDLVRCLLGAKSPCTEDEGPQVCMKQMPSPLAVSRGTVLRRPPGSALIPQHGLALAGHLPSFPLLSGQALSSESWPTRLHPCSPHWGSCLHTQLSPRPVPAREGLRGAQDAVSLFCLYSWLPLTPVGISFTIVFFLPKYPVKGA